MKLVTLILKPLGLPSVKLVTLILKPLRLLDTAYTKIICS